MTGTVVALLFVLLASCGGSSAVHPSPSPSATPAPTDTPTPTPAANAGAPDRDLRDLAHRYRGVAADAPLAARTEPYKYTAGDSADFFVMDLDTPKVTTITATVRLITDHAYFFVENGASYSQSALQTIGSDFETMVYPTVRRDFGDEPSPGVDSDPRITILHANLKGAGGYFSLSDEYPRAIAPRSNEREILYLEANALGSPGAPYNALVAHELQHMVHWNADHAEDSWVNEGMSQVAAEEVGGGSEWLSEFLDNPDTQLTFWPAIEDAGIHYAAAELFCSYLLDHYGGRERAKDVLAEQSNGIDGVEAYLQEFGKSFDDVFADWAAANWLDTGDSRYSHLGVRAQTRASTPVGPGDGSGTVGQFATDYLAVSGAGTLTFDGADSVGPGVGPADGGYWWSNRGDGVDTRLTREVDLRGLQTATLRFRTWYDIERGWDYAYVAVSTDGGDTWQALPGQNTTDYNPVEAAYGPGYTGQSSGWVPEQVDLSKYAGKKVLLRFEYVTDDSSSLTGFAVDDIEIPETGYTDHAEAVNGWRAEGFERVAAPLKQKFIVQVIQEGQAPAVTPVDLDSQNRAEIQLNGPAVVAVSGATRGTAETATYNWAFR
ncbi:MAG TPA: choice-of-anchor J domain-containing protein [Dehalococcoidia bacterium]|nr:choice-of-anchor J domain-containing protein [Dehalococcoidia bacterium]